MSMLLARYHAKPEKPAEPQAEVEQAVKPVASPKPKPVRRKSGK